MRQLSSSRFPSPKELVVLLVLMAICFGTAALGSWFTTNALQDWYPTLRKPVWTPPNWVFGPVWTTLYLLMALSAWLVWRCASLERWQIALGLFLFQLALNAAWSGLFFTLHRPGSAFAEILVLWCAIAATLWSFARTSRLAAGLFAPYLIWVTFAAVLNGVIWRMNATTSF